jgi:hypothetical protein
MPDSMEWLADLTARDKDPVESIELHGHATGEQATGVGKGVSLGDFYAYMPAQLYLHTIA